MTSTLVEFIRWIIIYLPSERLIKIIVMEQGELVEQGKNEELIKLTEGKCSKLVQL